MADLPLPDLDPVSDRAVFRQIADHLREAIERGALREGEKIPSEAQLIEHYGVARMTVRNALQVLQSEGLTVAEHGRGVFVRLRPPVRRLASDRFARRHRDAGKAAFIAETEEAGGAGVVENVIDEREWDGWDDWVLSFRVLRYKTRLIAFNSMHAQGTRCEKCPQSRDRLWFPFWHESLGREPDWDKWLRPLAYCVECDETISAIQVFKNPRRDMGRYRQSYVYRCPRVSCRNSIVEPMVLPAAAAIDWSIPATRIGDRPKTAKKPDGLAPATIARIKAGMEKYWRPIILEAAGHTYERRPGVRTRPVDDPFTAQTTTATKALAVPPLIVPAGGTWRDAATSADIPIPARTTRENDGVALPPLVVPVEGRERKRAAPADQSLRTQTGRNETGLALPPFVIPFRGGGDSEKARDIATPLHTVSAEGNHHGFIPGFVMRNNGSRGDGAEHCTPFDEHMRTVTTKGHQSIVTWPPTASLPSIQDVLFRMLEPKEIGRAMAFADDYIVLGIPREQVRQYGNAVTPPVAELLISALVEAITGEDLERAS